MSLGKVKERTCNHHYALDSGPAQVVSVLVHKVVGGKASLEDASIYDEELMKSVKEFLLLFR